jgi:hypothetical protein
MSARMVRLVITAPALIGIGYWIAQLMGSAAGGR